MTFRIQAPMYGQLDRDYFARQLTLAADDFENHHQKEDSKSSLNMSASLKKLANNLDSYRRSFRSNDMLWDEVEYILSELHKSDDSLNIGLDEEVEYIWDQQF